MKYVLPANFQERLAVEGVVTHLGQDLDNRMAVEALRRHYGLAEVFVESVPAGQPKHGRINVDVGDSTCTEPVVVDLETGTVVIDHHFAKKPDGTQYKNTLEILRDCLGIYVPAQLVEIADQHVEVDADPLDWRTPLSLGRYMSSQEIWELAEKGLLTRPMTDEELRKYGLERAAQVQKEIIDAAVEAVQAGAVPGTKIVVVDRFVPAGSLVAYRLGYDVYVSVQEHEKGGYTFAATARPGTKLPGSFLEWARELQKKYGNGVFIRPDGAMVVAGGPKNPDFSVQCDPEEIKEAVLRDAMQEKVLDKMIRQQEMNVKQETAAKAKGLRLVLK